MKKTSKIVAFDVGRECYTEEYVEHLEQRIAQLEAELEKLKKENKNLRQIIAYEMGEDYLID